MNIHYILQYQIGILAYNYYNNLIGAIISCFNFYSLKFCLCVTKTVVVFENIIYLHLLLDACLERITCIPRATHKLKGTYGKIYNKKFCLILSHSACRAPARFGEHAWKLEGPLPGGLY